MPRVFYYILLLKIIYSILKNKFRYSNSFLIKSQDPIYLLHIIENKRTNNFQFKIQLIPICIVNFKKETPQLRGVRPRILSLVRFMNTKVY
jgi:hypothetical protein